MPRIPVSQHIDIPDRKRCGCLYFWNAVLPPINPIGARMRGLQLYRLYDIPPTRRQRLHGAWSVTLNATSTAKKEIRAMNGEKRTACISPKIGWLRWPSFLGTNQTIVVPLFCLSHFWFGSGSGLVWIQLILIPIGILIHIRMWSGLEHFQFTHKLDLKAKWCPCEQGYRCPGPGLDTQQEVRPNRLECATLEDTAMVPSAVGDAGRLSTLEVQVTDNQTNP